jgi:ABC-2 type transport system ATP-binding protein
MYKSDYAIEVSDIHKSFRKLKRYREMLKHPFRKELIPALMGVDLKVNKGELFVLLGPNGAGKTTLIKTLCTLIMPNKGTAHVNGYDIVEEGDAVRHSIGYVISEERSFYWRLTGRQNLKFFAALYNLFGVEADRRIEKVLEITGLRDIEDKMFMDYSTGMRQKLGIARGLLVEPEILFMDEPTRSLDPTIAAQLREFVIEHLVKKGGKTVFFSTHNLYEAEISDSLAIIHQGKIRLQGPLKEIWGKSRDFVIGLKKPENGFLAAIGHMDMIHNIKTLPARPEGPELEIEVRLDEKKGDISDLIGEIVRLQGKILFCSPRQTSLHEIFKQATSLPEPG